MKIAKDKIDQWFERIQRGYEIFGPVRNKDTVEFKPVDKFKQMDTEAMASTMSVKGIIYPQCQAKYRFAREDGKWSVAPIEVEDKAKLVFGARPCDAEAFKVLDANFIRDDFEDTQYKQRRNKTAFVVIACNEPLKTCFCTSVGGSPSGSDAADVVLTDIGDYYHATYNTDEGKELIMMASDIFVDAEDDDKKAVEAKHMEAESKIPALFDFKEAAKVLDEKFDSPYWQRAIEKCLSCGYCTFTCPTCYCFNVTDEKCGDFEAERLASWDACMFYGFTRMAGGHNPRNDKYRRFRQRSLHKFRYFVNNKGFAACVGCGRCIQGCPVGIDISKVIKGAIEQSE